MSLQGANNAPAEDKKGCEARFGVKKSLPQLKGEAAEEFFSSL